jgi:hypothetical protein
MSNVKSVQNNANYKESTPGALVSPSLSRRLILKSGFSPFCKTVDVLKFKGRPVIKNHLA